MTNHKWALVLAVAILISVGCGEDIAVVGQNADAGCITKEVHAGSNPDQLFLIDDCGSSGEVAIQAGGAMSVDEAGLGYFDLSNSCETITRIYVFFSSKLERSRCTESANTNGNTCLTDGHAAWQNNCKGEVVITPSSDVELIGTWVWVSYLPDTNLTLVVPFEGQVETTSLLDDAADPVTVEPGQFWLTGREGTLPAEANVALPFEQLPDVVRELRLEPWAVDIQEQLAIDDIPLPGPLIDGRALNVRMAGGVLDDSEVADLALQSVDWATVLELTRSPTITSLNGSAGRIPVQDIPYEPSGALAERLVDQIPLLIGDRQGDPEFSTAGQVIGIMADYFAEFGIEVELVQMATDEGRARYLDAIDQGRPVIYVSGG